MGFDMSELRGDGKYLPKLMDCVEHIKVIVGWFWWIIPVDGFLSGIFVKDPSAIALVVPVRIPAAS